MVPYQENSYTHTETLTKSGFQGLGIVQIAKYLILGRIPFSTTRNVNLNLAGESTRHLVNSSRSEFWRSGPSNLGASPPDLSVALNFTDFRHWRIPSGQIWINSNSLTQGRAQSGPTSGFLTPANSSDLVMAEPAASQPPFPYAVLCNVT